MKKGFVLLKYINLGVYLLGSYKSKNIHTYLFFINELLIKNVQSTFTKVCLY